MILIDLVIALMLGMIYIIIPIIIGLIIQGFIYQVMGFSIYRFIDKILFKEIR